MKAPIYITVEEARLYENIARQHNMSYSSPIPHFPSFLNTKKLKKKGKDKDKSGADKLKAIHSNPKSNIK